MAAAPVGDVVLAAPTPDPRRPRDPLTPLALMAGPGLPVVEPPWLDTSPPLLLTIVPPAAETTSPVVVVLPPWFP